MFNKENVFVGLRAEQPPPLIEQVVVVLFFKNIVFFHGKRG